MNENNKIYVTTSSQTISTTVKVDNSGYYTEKAKQYAEQSEASAQKSQANVDRLLANEDFINVSQNLDLIVEAGQKIEGVDLEAILNAEASAKQSSESALASANLSEENAQTTTTNAQLSKTYRDECEDFSETSKGYMDNTNYYYKEVNSLAVGCRSEYEKARTEANNAWRYSIDASISETNAKASENKVVAKANEIQELVKNVPENFTTLPIGTIIPISASSVYTPTGTLPCDGAEYQKADFKNLWDKYLIAGLLNTCTYDEYDQDITTYGQCSKFAVKPLEYDGSGLSVVGSPTITEDGVASGFSVSNGVDVALNQIENPFSIVLEWTSGDTISNAANNWQDDPFISLNGSNAGLVVGQRKGRLQIRATSASDGSGSFIADGLYGRENVFVPNTKYIIKIEYDGANYNFTVNEELIYSVTSDKYPKVNVNGKISLGRYGTNNAITNGSIDLKQFSIIVNGKTVFDCIEGNTFKVPTITNENTDLKNFVTVANGTVNDCLATWNTLLELENYLKGV